MTPSRVMYLPLYNVNTADGKSIRTQGLHLTEESKQITQRFWKPNPHILDRLTGWLERRQIRSRILDVGCGATPFPPATHLVDYTSVERPGKMTFRLDLDFDRFPQSDGWFDFVYCRHTLEDIMNPLHAFQELTRLSSRGYIETPSPLVEILKGVDGSAHDGTPAPHRGYNHHRYIVWSELDTNTLHFLPKYGLVEYLDIAETERQYAHYLANHYPLYWNNYYLWDETKEAKAVVYRNGVNMKLNEDYSQLISRAITQSIRYADAFLSRVSA